MSAVSSHSLVRDVLLRDGSTLRLRDPAPADLDDIKVFYDERLSDESRYMRFHGYLRTEVAPRAYAEANGIDRVALIGRQGDKVVAAASYDLLREPGAAEVAFAVADRFRGRGTATRMLEQLAAIASERGVGRFDAEVMLGTSRPMLLVFERAGFGVRRKGTGGELTVSLDITPSEEVRTHRRARPRRCRGVAAADRGPAIDCRRRSFRSARRPRSCILEDILDGGFRGVVTPVNRTGEVVCSMRSATAPDRPPRNPRARHRSRRLGRAA